MLISNIDLVLIIGSGKIDQISISICITIEYIDYKKKCYTGFNIEPWSTIWIRTINIDVLFCYEK